MRKALITGGAGYIGHHLQKELKKHGYYVTILDKKHHDKMMSNKYYDRYIQGDLTDYQGLRDILRIENMFAETNLEFDIVFHLAGLLEVGEGEKEPIRYYENNVAGTINVLKLMKEYNCDKIVFSSSAGVYNEYGQLDPVSIYGSTKLLSEKILFGAKSEGINCVNLRYFNVAGADVNAEFGENHFPESHVLPRILSGNSFCVYGNDYDTPDGTCIRDYIHVVDVADAHIKAAEWLYEDKDSISFNIGSGTGYSVKNILSMVEKTTGMKIDTTYGDRRPGDPAKLVCDTSQTERWLKFKPKHSLEDIITTAYRWEVIQRRQPNDSI